LRMRLLCMRLAHLTHRALDALAHVQLVARRHALRLALDVVRKAVSKEARRQGRLTTHLNGLTTHLNVDVRVRDRGRVTVRLGVRDNLDVDVLPRAVDRVEDSPGPRRAASLAQQLSDGLR